ncbi:MAG TPA: hypothetical protein VE687_05380 [Stellaceae bacterium]|nr:hypothetical protein [Stellaceae bacterium]
MALMLSKTYDAFIAAGAPEQKAREAAEELAAYETRFAKVEQDLAIIKGMLGVVIAGVASLIIKAFA